MSLLLALAATTALQAAPVPAAKPAMHSYMGLSLAPDGAKMATFEVGKPDSPHMVVTLRDPSGKVTGTADPCETCRYDSAVWSPDGKALAFLANDAKAGTVTLFVLENGAPRSVTSFKGIAGRPLWSPDGQTLSVLATVNPHKLTGATQAGAAQVGEIGIAQSIDEQRIAIVPVKGGDLKFVSPDDTFVYEYDWTPDGSGFVATSAKGDGDNNWWTAQLVAYPISGAPHLIAAPKVQMNDPTVTKDGKSVLFIGGLMSDFGSVGGDVYTVPLAGGEPTNLTKDAKVTFTNLTLTKAGLITGIITGGESGLAKVDITKGGYTVLSHSEVSTAGISLDASGTKAAAVMQSYTQAPAIAVGTVGGSSGTSLKPVTHDNDGFTVPFTAKSVSWTNEGFNVQGWLLIPNNLDPKKTYPMVTIVHGGPAAAYTPRFTSAGTTFDLLKAGYFVFQPNPRGSYGQGEAFTQANKRDFGGGDLRDILTGIDAVEKVAPVDDKRLGIFGHSYGGLMTMWTVTQTTRFKAGVAGAGIANWSSYYGQNGIDQWMIPFFGASFYDDPAIYDKLSPIRYIKNAKTPTFIYVGERDVECPAPQSQEFWHGLKAMGVDTSLVIYEGEGHGIRDPKHAKDLSDRIANWFGKYLGQP